jgi:hypothetical protein
MEPAAPTLTVAAVANKARTFVTKGKTQTSYSLKVEEFDEWLEYVPWDNPATPKAGDRIVGAAIKDADNPKWNRKLSGDLLVASEDDAPFGEACTASSRRDEGEEASSSPAPAIPGNPPAQIAASRPEGALSFKDRLIVAQVAYKTAPELVKLEQHSTDMDKSLDVWAYRIYQGILSLVSETTPMPTEADTAKDDGVPWD